MFQRISGRALSVLLGLAFTLCLVQGSKAQTLYGSLIGAVTDSTGAVIPKAHVVLNNPLTNLKRETDTDEAGRYAIPNLPDGAYDVTVSASGFKPLTQTAVAIKVG